MPLVCLQLWRCFCLSPQALDCLNRFEAVIEYMIVKAALSAVPPFKGSEPLNHAQWLLGAHFDKYCAEFECQLL